MRDLYWTFRNFRNRVTDFLRYRRVTANMDERFPEASAEDLARCDGVCIICREEMAATSRNKRLPCGHVFHLHCLRSGLHSATAAISVQSQPCSKHTTCVLLIIWVLNASTLRCQLRCRPGRGWSGSRIVRSAGHQYSRRRLGLLLHRRTLSVPRLSQPSRRQAPFATMMCSQINGSQQCRPRLQCTQRVTSARLQ